MSSKSKCRPTSGLSRPPSARVCVASLAINRSGYSSESCPSRRRLNRSVSMNGGEGLHRSVCVKWQAHLITPVSVCDKTVVKLDMETLEECPVCGSSQIGALYHSLDVKITREVFCLERCSNCGFCFTNARPSFEEIGSYYGPTYYAYKKPPVKVWGGARSQSATGKRLLDLGCGAGTMVLRMRTQGHEVFGVDIDDNSISCCHSAGLRVWKAARDI